MKRYFLLCLLTMSSLALCAQETSIGLLASNEGITNVNTDKTGVTVETKVVIEKEGSQVRIVFWQETTNGFLFKDANWAGLARLQLENGEVIRLVDRSLNGHSMHKGGYIAGYFVPDIYQRYATYYLTDQECAKLKAHRLINVTYQLDDAFEPTTKHLYLRDNQFAIRDQLIAIGK